MPVTWSLVVVLPRAVPAASLPSRTAGRLRLDHAVACPAAGCRTGTPVGPGRGRLVHRPTQVVGPEQPHLHPGDPGLAGRRSHAVVVRVVEHGPGQAGPFDLAEVEPGAGGRGGQVDPAEPVVGHAVAAGVPFDSLPSVNAVGWALGDGVGARGQPGERVAPSRPVVAVFGAMAPSTTLVPVRVTASRRRCPARPASFVPLPFVSS